jgi:hypothetical protein
VAGENRVKVENRILDEIANDNYVLCNEKPRVISSLAAVAKGDQDIRLIHDLSRPNGGGQLAG